MGPARSESEDKGSTVVYDCKGRVVAVLTSGRFVPLEEVADPLWQAVVASEDRRYFEHVGVDFKVQQLSLFP